MSEDQAPAPLPPLVGEEPDVPATYVVRTGGGQETIEGVVDVELMATGDLVLWRPGRRVAACFARGGWCSMVMATPPAA